MLGKLLLDLAAPIARPQICCMIHVPTPPAAVISGISLHCSHQTRALGQILSPFHCYADLMELWSLMHFLMPQVRQWRIWESLPLHAALACSISAVCTMCWRMVGQAPTTLDGISHDTFVYIS